MALAWFLTVVPAVNEYPLKRAQSVASPKPNIRRVVELVAA